MILLELRAGLVFGPVLAAAGLYPLRGWQRVFLWTCLRRHAIVFPTPMRAR